VNEIGLVTRGKCKGRKGGEREQQKNNGEENRGPTGKKYTISQTIQKCITVKKGVGREM